ncbi:MAG TPA: M28 family peptidase, partial [Candidatus Dormibacteraeota bacterium]|nr:M28 family peptidase [Candidatus Dormibacteraeota bacterium]
QNRMGSRRSTIHEVARKPIVLATMSMLVAAVSAFAQQAAPRDPAEPPQGKPQPKILPRPLGAFARQSVDEKSMRALIHNLVSCGTRLTLSSWTDPKRGIGCGRDVIVARLNEIAKESGGKLQIVVDKFDSSSERTSGKPIPLENVYAILPGTDPKLAKRLFIVSGHFDSRPSDVMDPAADAPGADDDSSGTAVSVECARLLSKPRSYGPSKGETLGPLGYRATILFAAVSGEEQGLLGSTHLVDWVKQQGYTVGGMLDDDIVGADPAPGGPHRVRLFSGNGEIDDADSPSRELARTVEEIDGRNAIRMIFRQDRYGRGGDHYPFYKAGLPAVRFTEPLEDYNHQHQTPRTENGIEYGDFEKYLNFQFMGDVARDNAEVLRQLAMAPASPVNARLKGAVTPDAKVSWATEEDRERVGFEILWRETTDPRWHVYDFVTDPGEAVLKGVSTDNHFFAVRSVGKSGARSLAVPTEMERRPPPLPTKSTGVTSPRSE